MLTIPLYDDNPVERTPIVTYAIIGTCVLVFLWQLGLSPRDDQAVSYAFGLVPAVFFGEAQLPPEIRSVPPWMTLFTSMFLHGGFMHLIGNMLFLWIFGNNVEDALGRVRFLLFYFLCGAAAGLTQAFTSPGSEVPMIGASGAIGGVLGAYILLHPHANVRVFVWIIVFVRLINVPAWILLGLWFAMQLFSGLATPGAEAGVAFWAHVGGFLAGIALVFVMHKRRVPLFQPARTQAFVVAPPGSFSQRAARGGSVPDSGIRRRGPWA